MIDLFIRFLRDIARERYESFVVLRDIDNLKTIPINSDDPFNGYFWDKQWELNNFSNEFLCANYPLLYVERGDRKIIKDGVFDQFFIGLAISRKAQLNLNQPDEDPLRKFLYDELTSLAITLQKAILAKTVDGDKLVTECNTNLERLSCDLIIENMEDMTITWTDVQVEGVSATSFEIFIRSSSEGFCFTPKPSLSIEKPATFCCTDD